MKLEARKAWEAENEKARKAENDAKEAELRRQQQDLEWTVHSLQHQLNMQLANQSDGASDGKTGNARRLPEGWTGWSLRKLGHLLRGGTMNLADRVDLAEFYWRWAKENNVPFDQRLRNVLRYVLFGFDGVRYSKSD
eukprot:CAMPEP_0179002606 /NCGR_PEP_ID=MMETSP0795-20121207/12144_1 /TAXON_ID=88552 /ORGANISM="Amoebophrya sp., Strain Ameob2" /LENGTH=136 /DNA_ID=CAMNT_0020696379 /DNA_START=26 /DNA_END=436 /DNA_ORIENTATION=-